MLLLQFGERALGLVSLGLLTRLLTPSDFGLVALASATSGMVTSALATNFSTAVISLPEPERSDYDTAWTLNAAQGSLLALAICCTSLATLLWGSLGQVPQILLGLSILPLLDGLRNIGMAVFRKRLQFFPIMFVALTSELLGTLGAVTVAFLTRSYWALVAGPVLLSAANLVGTFVASAYRPRVSLSSWRKLWRFSGWLAGGNLVGTVSSRADIFFVNHYLGLSMAGIYNMGKQHRRDVLQSSRHAVARKPVPGPCATRRRPRSPPSSFSQGERGSRRSMLARWGRAQPGCGWARENRARP